MSEPKVLIFSSCAVGDIFPPCFHPFHPLCCAPSLPLCLPLTLSTHQWLHNLPITIIIITAQTPCHCATTASPNKHKFAHTHTHTHTHTLTRTHMCPGGEIQLELLCCFPKWLFSSAATMEGLMWICLESWLIGVGCSNCTSFMVCVCVCVCVLWMYVCVCQCECHLAFVWTVCGKTFAQL